MAKRVAAVTVIYVACFCVGILLGLHMHTQNKVSELPKSTAPVAEKAVIAMSPPTPLILPTATPVEAPIVEKGYMLFEEEGKIAVYNFFSNGETTFSEWVDINVETFRTDDRNRLQNGIHVATKRDLAQLIEDLMS